jgi:hypothetical protein
MASTTVTLTILDLPEVLEIIEACLAVVPAGEQQALRTRLEQLLARARRGKEGADSCQG